MASVKNSPTVQTRGSVKKSAVRCGKCRLEAEVMESSGGSVCRQCASDMRLDEVIKRLGIVEVELDSAKERIVSLVAENCALTEEKKELMEQVQGLRQDLEKNREDWTELSDRLKMVAEEVGGVRQGIEELTTDCRELRQSLDKHEKRTERLEWAVESEKKETINEDGKPPEVKTVDTDRKSWADIVTRQNVKTGVKTCIPAEQEIVVLGSSMAIGVGVGLKDQHKNVRILAKRGGLLSDVIKQAERVELSGKEQVVILAGGNNVDRGDGTEDIMEDYGKVIHILKQRGVSVTMVGPSSRGHFGPYMQSKIYGINNRLKKLCVSEGIGYVEVGLRMQDRVTMLARDGVHFNRYGVWEAGRLIYDCVKRHLNLPMVNASTGD